MADFSTDFSPPSVLAAKAALLENDATDWQEPPPHDAPFAVDIRFNCYTLADVNTAEGTAYVRMIVNLYWTDTRLTGYEDRHLPTELWGPWVVLGNARGEVTVVQEDFSLNRTTGEGFNRHDARPPLSTFPLPTISLPPRSISLSPSSPRPLTPPVPSRCRDHAYHGTILVPHDRETRLASRRHRRLSV